MALGGQEWRQVRFAAGLSHDELEDEVVAEVGLAAQHALHQVVHDLERVAWFGGYGLREGVLRLLVQKGPLLVQVVRPILLRRIRKVVRHGTRVVVVAQRERMIVVAVVAVRKVVAIGKNQGGRYHQLQTAQRHGHK